MELTITGFILLFFIAAICCTDLWLYTKVNKPTFSTLMQFIASKWPLFPPVVAFIMGILFGHFFF